MTADLMSPRAPAPDDRPRRIVVRRTTGDRVFRGAMRTSGLAVLAVTAMILIFLLTRGIGAFRRAGFSFFTTEAFNPSTTKFGILSLLVNGVIIAAVALVIAVPVAVATSLYISEYAPRSLRRTLTTMIDLMAAIPSIVYAMWGLYFVLGRWVGVETWLARHLSFIPIFRVTGPATVQSSFVDSPFVVGVVVACLVIPIITSLCREIFSQAPVPEREAAYALGATRWGMIRAVVLPFGRSGIIGSSMLGMGRALGDAIVISFLITPIYNINGQISQSGGNSIPEAILLFKNSGPEWIAALMAAGVVLFAMTLVINILGAVVTGRSRSGLVTV